MPGAGRGSDAEDLACRFLQTHGLVLLERNYRCRRGEIDIIVQDADTLVFVEVRYRRQNRYGSAAESIDRHKQSRLSACALHYLQTSAHAADPCCRFDVVAIGGSDRAIEWIRNAFSVTA